MKTKNNEEMFQAEVLEERMEMARAKWFATTSADPNRRIVVTASFDI